MTRSLVRTVKETILVAILNEDDKPIWVTRLNGEMEVEVNEHELELVDNVSVIRSRSTEGVFDIHITGRASGV